MTMLQKLYGRLLTLIAFIAIGGCQTAPPPPPSAAQLITAAEAVASQAARDYATLEACAALGGEISSQASDTREIWLFNNEKLLNAAALNMAQQRNDWVSVSDTDYSLSTIQLFKTEQAATLARLNLAQRGPDNQKSTCQSALTAIESRRLDQQVEEPRALAALLAHGDGLVADNLQFDHYASHFKASVLPGRSYFAVFESLKDLCPDRRLEVDTLVNQWPEEYYSAICQGEPLMLIHCQWAECTQQQPATRTIKSDNYDRYRIL
ncbi:MAG TPA: hypothetical protein VIC08_01985 [Cellvibrionaceae bacterium]